MYVLTSFDNHCYPSNFKKKEYFCSYYTLLPLSQDETEQILGTCAEHQERTPPSQLKEGIKSSVRKNHLAKIMKTHPDWSIPGKYSKKENPEEIIRSKISALIPCGADKSLDKDFTEPPTHSTLFDYMIILPKSSS